MGSCQDGPAGSSEPLGSLLEHLIEYIPADVLRAHSSRCGGQLTRIAPRLVDRAGIPGTVVSDDAERHLMFEAVADVLRRLAD